MAPMLVVQVIVAESWLQLADADTMVGVQGTGEIKEYRNES